MSGWTRRTFCIAMLVTLGCAAQARAQDVPPPTPPMTLWRFLGIPDGIRRVRGNLVNRRGNLPALEQKPPMKALADPANLVSENPAIKAAAEIKAAELLAPQKIKALKYLAKIGCGCYDKDGKITNALIAAMADDCTEDVRLNAVRAVSEAARGQVCSNCNLKCCCNEKVLKQLASIAYDRDEFGCWLEPSARVRREAEEALRVCCTGNGPPEFLPPAPAEKVEGVEGVEESTEGLPPAPPMDARHLQSPAPVFPAAMASLRTETGGESPARLTGTAAPMRTASAPLKNYFALDPPHAAQNESIEGAIIYVSPRQSHGSVRFTTRNVVPVGTQLFVYQETPEGIQTAGMLMVASSRPGEATVVAPNGAPFAGFEEGDVVVGTTAEETIRR